MRSRSRLIWMALAWAAATALTAGVALAVVGLAGEQVADEAVRPLTADEVEALGMPPTTAAGTTAAPTTAAPGLDATDPALPGQATTSATAPASTAPPTTQSSPGTTAPPTTTSAATSTTNAPPSGEPVVDSRRITGGTVVVRWTSSWVEFVSATPDDGFDVDVDARGPEHVEVEFEGQGVTSHYVAEVSDGVLVVQTEVDDEAEQSGTGEGGDD